MYFPLHLAALLYVLTGGPSVGKTSILNELEKQGEPTIREAATDFIAGQIDSGIHEFWKERDLNLNILKLQLEREKPFQAYEGRVFCDRGIFDPFAYAPQCSLAETKELSLMNAAVRHVDLNQHYAAIFLILPYKDSDFIPSQTEVRRENTQQFTEIQAALYAVYCRHKNFIIVPGNLTPAERATFILSSIKKIEDQSS